jgi:chromosome segregation ATPase
MRRKHFIDMVACAALIAVGSAQGATRREGGAESSQQHVVQQMMQQNATLEQEKAALAEERDGLKAQLDKLNATHADDQKALDRSKDAANALTVRFNDLLGKHTDLQTQDKSTQEKLQDAERRIKILNGKIAGLAHQDAACEGDNRKLYQLNVELLERYRKKGVFDALLQHEPVTGLKDVDMQNVIQKYRDEIDAQSISNSTVTSK